MAHEPGYTAVQKIPGDWAHARGGVRGRDRRIPRFASAQKLTCWAGLTPKHHESDTHVHRGQITKQGSRPVRWAAIESVKNVPAGSVAGGLWERVADRRGPQTSVPPLPGASWSSSSTRCATVTYAHWNTCRGWREHHPRSFPWSVQVVQVMTPVVARSLRSDCPCRPVAPRTPSCRPCRCKRMTCSPPRLPPRPDPRP